MVHVRFKYRDELCRDATLPKHPSEEVIGSGGVYQDSPILLKHISNLEYRFSNNFG